MDRTQHHDHVRRTCDDGFPRFDGIDGADPRRTLTIEEACGHLGISRTLGYDLARQGTLPGVLRLGRRLVGSRTVLDRVLGAAGLVEHVHPENDDPENGGTE